MKEIKAYAVLNSKKQLVSIFPKKARAKFQVNFEKAFKGENYIVLPCIIIFN